MGGEAYKINPRSKLKKNIIFWDKYHPEHQGDFFLQISMDKNLVYDVAPSENPYADFDSQEPIYDEGGPAPIYGFQNVDHNSHDAELNKMTGDDCLTEEVDDLSSYEGHLWVQICFAEALKLKTARRNRAS